MCSAVESGTTSDKDKVSKGGIFKPSSQGKSKITIVLLSLFVPSNEETLLAHLIVAKLS